MGPSPKVYILIKTILDSRKPGPDGIKTDTKRHQVVYPDYEFMTLIVRPPTPSSTLSGYCSLSSKERGSICGVLSAWMEIDFRTFCDHKTLPKTLCRPMFGISQRR